MTLLRARDYLQALAKRKRGGSGKRLRRAFVKFNGVCFYCKMPTVMPLSFSPGPPKGYLQPQNQATVDHIIPLALGGGYGEDNMVLACYCCNNHKGNKPRDEFIQIPPQELA